MSKSRKLKEYLNDYGLNPSSRKTRLLVQEYNNNEMPLGDRMSKIVSGNDKNFIDHVKMHQCPSCGGFFVDSGSYCSSDCLNRDLPY